MNMRTFRDELADEVGTILGKDFAINVTTTNAVPQSDDAAITFPNLDEKKQGCKLIETCVLYIDIRRSTELNLTHKQQTVAKLYSAFVRAMTKCARKNNGHVRGIIGDRVMVLFDTPNAFAEAVDTAILMHSAAQYVINRYFTRNEVECGIGIDAGKMLATKTGFRRRGVEQHNYRSLVWLGRPANVASKLTDLANKPGEKMILLKMRVAYEVGAPQWFWRDEWPHDFVTRIGAPGDPLHSDPRYRSHYPRNEEVETRPRTPPILMTDIVYRKFCAARPADQAVKGGWFKPVEIEVPGYSGKVYGGDVHYTVFSE